MKIENYIETQYRELLPYGLNNEHTDLYVFVRNQKLRGVLTTLHYHLVSLFRTMNERLPTGENGAHFWAEPSRSLIKIIEITIGTYNAVKGLEYAFEIDSYYNELILKCRDFLSSSGGSVIPANMQKIELYYIQRIFLPTSAITVPNLQTTMNFELKYLGEGSYANVYRYRDTFYNRNFALKRAKKDLTEKELARFRREFDEMNDFSSPYILEVYCYNTEKNEYIMEYMDDTLDAYITKNNGSLTAAQRKGIAQQILRAFDYIHSKNRLHRDVSPKNILIRVYDDVPVVKIADFGLVKIPDSSLTTANTEFKGYFNDPSLIIDGFDTYNIHHETYALTRVIYYVMTGRTNTEKAPDSLRDFVQRGLSADKAKRFKNTNEMAQALRAI